MSNKVFDPEVQEEQIRAITPEQFGIAAAEVFRERRSSGDYLVVQKVIEKITGWDAEHAQVEELIDRIAGLGES